MPATRLATNVRPRDAGLQRLGWGGTATATDAVRLMSQFPDEEVGAQGCFRLNRLARRGEAQAVVDAGGAAAIMGAMRAHPHTLELQEEGLHGLGYLLETGGEAMLNEVREAGGAELLQAAQDHWPDKKFVMYFCTSALEQLWAPAAQQQPRDAQDAAATSLPATPATLEFDLEPEPEPEEDFSLPHSFAPGGGGGGTRRLLPPVYI
jgi:hypothetical protein